MAVFTEFRNCGDIISCLVAPSHRRLVSDFLGCSLTDLVSSWFMRILSLRLARPAKFPLKPGPDFSFTASKHGDVTGLSCSLVGLRSVEEGP